jgi:hypothetical protein
MRPEIKIQLDTRGANIVAAGRLGVASAVLIILTLSITILVIAVAGS